MSLIEPGIVDECLLRDVPGQDREEEDGERGVDHVEGGEVEIIKQTLRREVGPEGVEELVSEAGDVLVEEILDHDGGSVVEPVAVDQDHFP